MKIITVIGARPQFVKAAVVSYELRKNHNEILVHTGQHYDYDMSEKFFEELNIPKPDYNLGISGGTHAQMTGKMLVAIEKVLKDENPDWVLVYGDTNSTLAAALAAAKVHIKICHVEAGARTHCLTNPEEINRLCVDHVSTLLLASTHSSMMELKKEGLGCRSVFVGDPMYDAFLTYRNKKDISKVRLRMLDGGEIQVPKNYCYLTCHREENTQNDDNLTEILKAMQELDTPTVYPVHPRNKERSLRIKKKSAFNKVLMTEPVGYLESLALINNAEKIVTDSGGLQREAFFAGKKCVTVLDFVTWPETMKDGRNTLSKPYYEDIKNHLKEMQIVRYDYQPFGDGQSASKIVSAIEGCKADEIFV